MPNPTDWVAGSGHVSTSVDGRTRRPARVRVSDRTAARTTGHSVGFDWTMVLLGGVDAVCSTVEVSSCRCRPVPDRPDHAARLLAFLPVPSHFEHSSTMRSASVRAGT